ncbi:PAS domain-containing sensor histidine kinase [Fredinandcohnia onubensis]|uniref:PAS domain-containing sensor histidine kinase n=1 Tax=Fredinandcohnia onubensis TaxID=1571209 RepID=UPI000C0BF996|nr:PAS domain-containing sensor histidine kinase [Fredinandcohnia onubensis]
MKYTGRIIMMLIYVVVTAAFKTFDYVELGYVPVFEYIISAIMVYPVWLTGLQYDKAKYYAQEAQKKDKELNDLFNSVDAAIYSFDFHTNRLMVSSKISDVYGYSPTEFKENIMFWKEVVTPEDMKIVNQLEQELRKGEECIAEYRILLPNGQLRWIQKRITPIFDLDGNLIKINGIDIDIDQRKKVEELLTHSQEQNRKLLEERLKESEQRFESLFVHNSDPIFTFDLDRKLIEANSAAENILGYTITELQQKEWDSIIAPEDLDLYREHFKRVSQGEWKESTLSMIHKDGSNRVIELKMIPIIIDHQCIGIYQITKDITESILAEERLRRSDKLAAVGLLAAGVAHEIRNPLTTLKGFVQLLMTDIDKHHADILLSEIDRINLIVSEFLILSKPQVIKYESQNIKLILSKITSILESQATLKGIQLISEYDLNIPFINCEQNQLKQVFINLIKNAIEAMPNGGKIIIKVKKINNKMIGIQIIDQGMGIEEERIHKLGEPFYTTKENGTGLGLMVCFRIIEQHGGIMNISSQINKGTTVEVCLPIDCPFRNE